MVQYLNLEPTRGTRTIVYSPRILPLNMQALFVASQGGVCQKHQKKARTRAKHTKKQSYIFSNQHNWVHQGRQYIS